MARCIAFDKQTAQAISRTLHLLTICDPDVNPLQYAMQGKSPVALLALPADHSQKVLLARIRRYRPLPPLADSAEDEPLGFEPTGFLGLSDEPVYEWKQEPPRKWWQKILE